MEYAIIPRKIVKLDILPITPAVAGFLKYTIERVNIAAAMSSIPMTKPTKPIILSKLSMNMNITRNTLPALY
jgi:hypothetical protein